MMSYVSSFKMFNLVFSVTKIYCQISLNILIAFESEIF